MNHLLAVLIFLPTTFGSGYPTSSISCEVAEQAKGGNIIETCRETAADGTVTICVTEYMAGVIVSQVCEVIE